MTKDQALEKLLHELPSTLALFEQMVKDKRITGALYVNSINRLIGAYNDYVASLDTPNQQ